MSELQRLIKRQLLMFGWDDYGLDIVTEANREWATDLSASMAEVIQVAGIAKVLGGESK